VNKHDKNTSSKRDSNRNRISIDGSGVNREKNTSPSRDSDRNHISIDGSGVNYDKNTSSSRDRRKEVLLDLMKDDLYVPMKEKELAVFLQVKKEDREELRSILRELTIDGKVVQTLQGKYKEGKGSALVGIYVANSKGYGFVEIEGVDRDFFIPEGMENGAFHKDMVEIALLGEREREGRRKEAQVIKIISRGIKQVVGVYRQMKPHFGFVTPDHEKWHKDIFIPEERSKGVKDGAKVVVEITDYGSPGKNPEGKITRILGDVLDPGVDILSVIYGLEIPVEFGTKVLGQASRVPQTVSEADRHGRRDLRDELMVTIDGEDAKDLDDAVSLRVEGGFYHLGVHIADVANYVQENSALDWEALARGTSVYLVDRVIPMLPKPLSNGICSLQEGEDRLALSCLMTIDQRGEVTDYELCETVICVNKRMTYTAVAKMLVESEETDNIHTYTPVQEVDDATHSGSVHEFIHGVGDAAVMEQVLETTHRDGNDSESDLLSMLFKMKHLSEILRKKRQKRGAIDFDFPECKIYVDEAGHPIEIKPYARNVATDLIEDFMLAANETVAQHFYWMEIPFLYRVHDTPAGDRISKLVAFIQNFGYFMKAVGRRNSKVNSEEVHPKELQKLLEHIVGTPEEAMISRMALRSMQKAKYSTECIGHFGLSCQYYCHFTSPIRRYPDLQIHRIIKEGLRGRLNDERIAHYRDILPGVAKQSSETERRADEAEREVDKRKKAEYMEDHLGEEFDGVISGITSWGIFVELPNTVEGLIHVSKLPGDYFTFRESTYEMVNRSGDVSYQLGQPLRICVEDCDRRTGTVDFSVAQ
jgi:ribonuclease R